MKRFLPLLLIVALMISISGCSRIHISQNELAVLTYHEPVVNNTETIVETLSAEESARVRQILTNAKYNPGIGGCYYTEDISFTFGDQVFAVACDGCETIWDIQNDKYYAVDQEDWAYIKALFKQYGGKLP